jgi:uncharacterized membrane protein YtjA (UPF0391 family)
MPMLYAALAFFVVALTSLVLGFLGIIRGAAPFVSMTLLAGLVLLAAGSVTNYWRRQLHH